MANYETVLRAELDAINSAIASCLANTATFDWSVGHVKINNVSKLVALREQRTQLIRDIQMLCPTESVESVIDGLDKFGNEAFDVGETD